MSEISSVLSTDSYTVMYDRKLAFSQYLCLFFSSRFLSCGFFLCFRVCFFFCSRFFLCLRSSFFFSYRGFFFFCRSLFCFRSCLFLSCRFFSCFFCDKNLFFCAYFNNSFEVFSSIKSCNIFLFKCYNTVNESMNRKIATLISIFSSMEFITLLSNDNVSSDSRLSTEDFDSSIFWFRVSEVFSRPRGFLVCHSSSFVQINGIETRSHHSFDEYLVCIAKLNFT